VRAWPRPLSAPRRATTLRSRRAGQQYAAAPSRRPRRLRVCRRPRAAARVHGRSRMGRPWKPVPLPARARPPKGRTLQPMSSAAQQHRPVFLLVEGGGPRGAGRGGGGRARGGARRGAAAPAHAGGGLWPARGAPGGQHGGRRAPGDAGGARARLTLHRWSRPPYPRRRPGRAAVPPSLSLGGPSADGAAARRQIDGFMNP